MQESKIEESVIAPRMKRTLPTSETTPDTRSGQRNITKSKESQKQRSGARKPFGTQSSCRVNGDEEAILNINDVISLEQLTLVKVSCCGQARLVIGYRTLF